jgi:lipoate-protein ligase A
MSLEKTTWRLLVDLPAQGAWNMAEDESLLEHVGRGESLPTLRLFSWEPACLSLGYAQPFADVDTTRLYERGWEIVRRPTGGRAILHTDELTYSITAPPDEPRVVGTVLESYNRLARALLIAVKSLGIPVEMKEHQPGGLTPPERHAAGIVPAAQSGQTNQMQGPVCFEVPSAYEITVGGKKLIGSAQARRREGVLQHGTLPLYGDLGRITQALVFPDDAARDAAVEKLLSRATTVESVLGRAVEWKTAAQAFVHAFETELNLTLERGELSAAEKARAEMLLREKYAHLTWTERV